MRMAKWCHKWLSLRAATLAPRTAESYQRLIRAYIVPAIGAKDLSKLKPKHVREAYAPALIAGHTRTAEQIFVLLNQILRAAIKSGQLEAFAFDRCPRPSHQAKLTAWWSPEDAAQFIRMRQLALDPHLTVWILALCLGLRRGELCGLRWSDFDLSARTVTIARQRVTLDDGRTITTRPKSRSSVRTLPISDDLATFLTCHCHVTGTSRDYVALSASTGQPITPSGLDQAWRRAVRDCAPAVPYITLHGLRHTCGASAVRAGVSMRVLQEIMGHSSMIVTSKIYAHADRKIIQAAIDKITALMLS